MSICTNRKAFHDYEILEKFEAGIVLLGWEIKSIRAGKVQLQDSYVKIKNHEVWLLGMQVTPLITAGTHILPDPTRLKKLLLNHSEINKLIQKSDQKGFTIITLDLHFKKGIVKATVALAKGKKEYDKRATLKAREKDMEAKQAIKKLKRL